MIFSAKPDVDYYPIPAIVEGRKTQTRRIPAVGTLVKIEGDEIVPFADVPSGTLIGAVYSPGGRLMYEVDRDNAVVPGRGLPSVIADKNGSGWHGIANGRNSATGRWTYLGSDGIEYPDMEFPDVAPLQIKLLGIRKERVTLIGGQDAVAEGAPIGCPDPIKWYQAVWDQVSSGGSKWQHNPAVLVYVFRKVQP